MGLALELAELQNKEVTETSVLAFSIKAVSPVLSQVSGSSMDQDQQLFPCSSNQINQSKLKPSEVCCFCTPLQNSVWSSPVPHAQLSTCLWNKNSTPSTCQPWRPLSTDTMAAAGCCISYPEACILSLKAFGEAGMCPWPHLWTSLTLLAAPILLLSTRESNPVLLS